MSMANTQRPGEARIIDGKRYLLICVEDGVEVDGVNIHIS